MIQQLFRSALPRGERLSQPRSRSPLCCFDPRSRAGSDRCWSRSRPVFCCFDPRSRAGSDADDRPITQLRKWFRSVLPRGERRRADRLFAGGRGFRSALPRGERHPRLPTGPWPRLFRSALPRGERQELDRAIPAAIEVSIRAPARGATIARIDAIHRVRRFDPRSRAGSDRRRDMRRRPSRCFDPRSRAGSDEARE